MKKKITFIILSLLFSVSLTAQNTEGWQWAKRGGSSAEITGSQFRDYGMERIVDVAVDSENNFYYLAEVGGYTFTLGNIEFETYNDQANYSDLFVFSTDDEGNFRWNKIIGGGGRDRAISLGVDNQDNVYVSGNTYNWPSTTGVPTPVHFDTDSIMPEATLSPSEANKRIFIIKYDKEGNFQWLQQPEGNETPLGGGGGMVKMVVNPDGITHSLIWLIQGSYFNGQLEVEEDNLQSVIVKYNSQGDFEDFILLDMKPLNDYYKYQMIYDPDLDRYYIADTYRDNPDPNDPLSINGYGAETVVKGFYLAAIDNQGDVLWYHENHTQNSYSIGDLQLDSEGNIYFTGSFQSDTGQDSFAGYVFEMGDNFTIQNPFLIKLDSDGNLIWGTNAIRYSPFNGQSIVINGDDVYLGLGMLHNTWDGVEITSPVNQGLIPDIQIMRFDAQTGAAQEVINGNATTSSQDAIMAMAMDSNGDLVVGGYFGSDLFYDTDLHIHNNATDSDFFIAKYRYRPKKCVFILETIISTYKFEV